LRHTDTDLDISKFYERSFSNTRDVLLFFTVRIAVYTQLKWLFDDNERK